MPPLRCSEHCRDRHVGRRVERERERGRVVERARESESVQKRPTCEVFCQAVKEAGRQLGVGESEQPGKSER